MAQHMPKPKQETKLSTSSNPLKDLIGIQLTLDTSDLSRNIKESFSSTANTLGDVLDWNKISGNQPENSETVVKDKGFMGPEMNLETSAWDTVDQSTIYASEEPTKENGIQKELDIPEKDFAVWETPALSAGQPVLPHASEVTNEVKSTGSTQSWPVWEDLNKDSLGNDTEESNANPFAAPAIPEDSSGTPTSSTPPLAATPTWQVPKFDLEPSPLAFEEETQTPAFEKPMMFNHDTEKDASSFTLVNQMSNISFTAPSVVQHKVLESNVQEDNIWGNAWAQ